MFNCTGWKIGWACGAPELIAGVRAAKQYLSYVGGAPFQPAVAQALNTEEAWVAALRESLQAKRDRLGSALAELGFEVHDSFGTYFLCADPRPLGYNDSTTFCAELPERAGVAAIPMSAFCDPGAEHADAWNHLVRFAFCKRDDTLDEAIRRLAYCAVKVTAAPSTPPNAAYRERRFGGRYSYFPPNRRFGRSCPA